MLSSGSVLNHIGLVGSAAVSRGSNLHVNNEV